MLLGDGVYPLAGLSGEMRAVWAEPDGAAVTIGADARDVEGGYVARFARLGTAVVLVRRDCYVFGAAASADGVDAMVPQLAAQVGLRQPAEVA